MADRNYSEVGLSKFIGSHFAVKPLAAMPVSPRKVF